MTTNRLQPDDGDDAQLAGLLRSGSEAPPMRSDFVESLSALLDAEFLAVERPLSTGASRDLLALNGHDAHAPMLGAADVANTADAVPLVARRPRRWGAVAAVAAAASLAVVFAMWGDRNAYGWASMIAALDRSPWLQAVASDGGGASSGWISSTQRVVAVRTEGSAVYADRRQGTASAFRSADSLVYEAQTSESWSRESELVAMLLAAAAKTPEGQLLDLGREARIEVVRESWRRVQQESRELIELRVDVRQIVAAGSGRLVSLELLLDPETQLPLHCRLLDAAGGQLESFEIKYPASGPVSIHSLGAPETAGLVNVASLSAIPAALPTKATSNVVGGDEPSPPKVAAAIPKDPVDADKQGPKYPRSPAAGVEARAAETPAWAPFDAPLAIDELARQVDDRLQSLWQDQGIRPVGPADDMEFMRRVYLDLTGRIPSVGEVRRFEEDKSADRRARLISDLLAHRDHATHLAAVWRRILLPDDVDLTPYGGAEKFEQWLTDRFAANVPYDQLVSDLLLAEGRISESGPLVFYAALKLNPEELAGRTSRAFMGVRMECAQCHDHPFDAVSQRDFWSFAAFFARISRPQGKMEMTSPVLRVHDSNFGDVKIPESEEIVAPRLPAANADLAEQEDGASRREALVSWLAVPNNAHFSKAAVNRVWAHLFGRGLVEPVDDMRPDNPPIAPEVLNLLSRDFAASGFDLRRLLEAITSTRAYQLTSRDMQDEPSRPMHFAQMNIKTFTAEQLYDCISVATQRSASAAPAGEPASLLRFADATRQSFIEQFRAPPGEATDYHAGIPQALTLMHGGLIHQVTDLSTSGMLRSLSAPFFSDAQRVDALFVATLSRHPSDEERQAMLDQLQTAGDDVERQQLLGDLLWALLNSGEFMFNH